MTIDRYRLEASWQVALHREGGGGGGWVCSAAVDDDDDDEALQTAVLLFQGSVATFEDGAK